MLVADTNVLIELFQPTANAEAVQAVWAVPISVVVRA